MTRNTAALLFALILLSLESLAQFTHPRFRLLSYADGLSSTKVNCIYKSTKGFLWIGTPMGLNRYDGIRIRSFYSTPNDKTLPNNIIHSLEEDAEGKLWIETGSGYCIFDPATEDFDRDVTGWMTRRSMKGKPQQVCADQKHNLWIETGDNNLYYYDFASKHAFTVATTRQQPRTTITDIKQRGQVVLLIFNDGTLLRVDAQKKRIVERLDYIPKHSQPGAASYSIFIDSHNHYWINTNGGLWCYDANRKQWTKNSQYIVCDINEDRSGNLIIGTDHDGLITLSPSGQTLSHLLNDPLLPGSLPDNTVQCVYVDNLGLVWLGTYRSGLAMYYGGTMPFASLPLGDICTMTEDQDGTLWLGTNDIGIEHYNLKTRQLQHIDKSQSGLGSNIVVASTRTADGSLWFGTFQGGMARLKDGHFTVYRQRPGGLTRDDVWALQGLPGGLLAVGTLGGGLQILNPQTGKFTTYNTQNSSLKSDYIGSLALSRQGYLVIGHSGFFSIMNLKTRQITNYEGNVNPTDISELGYSVNQVCCDSRGLIWVATISGLAAYVPSKKKLYKINLQGMRPRLDVAAITEDNRGGMWVTTSDGVRYVLVKQSEKGFEFVVNTFGEYDGLQTRMFNKRSILCMHDGLLLLGGIDGVNTIQPSTMKHKKVTGQVVFDDLSIYNHIVTVGEKFNGHVILNKSINEERRIVLHHDESDIFIALSTSDIGMPHKPRFLYRLKGLRDDWTMTSDAQMGVRFNNLSPGHYQLEVRAMDNSGNPMSPVAKLKIVVKPPFYLSLWAFAFYISLCLFLLWYIRKNMLRKRREAEERMEIKKEKEVEEMKLVFFTNISHELRTPLTLILSPLPGMIESETSNEMVKRLKLIQRNARKLLELVNQMLDLRRLMKNKEIFHPDRGNIVSFTQNICNQFVELTDKDITLTFHASAEVIIMSFDPDKYGKIVSNLLSNAFKFTPKDGRIDVSIATTSDQRIQLRVADNGIGISDEDKKHLFERFYQSKDNTSGGSGIGLNLVWEYTNMHGGEVSVSNNPGGGALFTVTLPMRQAEIGGKKISEAQCSPSQSEQENLDNETEHAKTYTVLVVDDNDDFLDFMQGELEDTYNVILAHNGKEALYKIDESQPDIVLTDIMMPEMDGNELCRRIKGDAATAHLPVVMLTARLSEENEIESRECGADDYIKKPFNLELLKLHIEQLLKNGKLNGDGKLDPKISQAKITSVDEKFVNDATAYIEQRLDDTTLSVETMSQGMGMSRVKLYRRMVAVTGKTPSEFIRLVRLRHAELLVKKSQLTVSEIAYKVGFSSPRTFTRSYKELFGYLPSQLKK